jgi:hypothetical protein
MCCVACGFRLDAGNEQGSLHHRIHGNRSDNRPSNKLVLHGTGITGCHDRARITGNASAERQVGEAERRGLVITRHAPVSFTLSTPVFYDQPHLARVGWYLLDDEAGLHGPLDADDTEDAGAMRRAIRAFIAGAEGGTTLAERQRGLRLLADVPALSVARLLDAQEEE